LYIGILEVNFNTFPPIVSFFNFGRADALEIGVKMGVFWENFSVLGFRVGF